MKYYVVSESELKEALKAVRTAELMASSSGVRDERFELLAEVAGAACRVREVPDWAEFIWSTNEGTMQCIWQRPK